MIVSDNFQDILEARAKFSTLNLPAVKQNLLQIEYPSGTSPEAVYNGPEPSLPFKNSDVFQAPISEWRRLTADDSACKPVYEVTFDITGSNFQFKPGDAVSIIPKNYSKEVDQIFKHLASETKADIPYILSAYQTVKGSKIPAHVPVKSTLRHVFTHCLDFRNVLKKLFIATLSQHTKDENEKKILEYMCSKEGSLTYNTHVLNKNLCLLDLFTIFKSCKPPIEILLANLPRLLPRPYSIVNSHLKDPNVLKICFSVMEISIYNNRKGLVTGLLEDIILQDSISTLEKAMNKLSIDSKNNLVPIYLRTKMSGSHILEDLERPLIMIGPGTGVAPFIGYLEERYTASMANPRLVLGEAWLIFGCRDAKLDFIYEKELMEFKSKGILNKLSVAHSRMDNAEYKYVQDAILKEGNEVYRKIENGASIFICGNLHKMAVHIKEVILQCLVNHGGKAMGDAEKFLRELEKDKRYLVDAWS